MINPVCCINHNLILHVYIRARFIWLKGQNILQQRSSLLIGCTSIIRGFWDETAYYRGTAYWRGSQKGRHLDKILAATGYLVALSTELIK